MRALPIIPQPPRPPPQSNDDDDDFFERNGEMAVICHNLYLPEHLFRDMRECHEARLSDNEEESTFTLY